MKADSVFPSKYLKSEEIEHEVTLTIKSVKLETMETKDKGEQSKPVIYFTDNPKGLVCNRTNWAIIAKQHGDESDEWIGKSITLCVMDVEAFGDVVSAIRVRPAPKKPAPAKPAPKVEGVTTAAELPADVELVTRYWTTVKNLGLNRAKGLEILKGAGGDFELALTRVEDDSTPF